MKKKLLSVLLAMSILSTPVVFNSDVNVPFSVNAEAAKTEKLDKPSSLKAKVSGEKITLSWKKVSGAEAYGVYKYDSAKKKYVKLKNVKTNKITVTADGSGTYKFRVYSLDKVDGKYKKGGYTNKKVTVAAKTNVLDDALKGLSLGMSKSNFLGKIEGKDYFVTGDVYLVDIGESDKFYCYQIKDNKLNAYGVAYEYSESKIKELKKLFSGSEWKCINDSPLEVNEGNLNVNMIIYMSDDKMATVMYEEADELVMALVLAR